MHGRVQGRGLSDAWACTGEGLSDAWACTG